MWKIATFEDANYFKNEKLVVSILISDGYDFETIQSILNTWSGFNIDSGDDWHLLIPSKLSAEEIHRATESIGPKGAEIITGKTCASIYDTDKVRKVITELSLGDEGFPLLFFESFETNEEAFYFSLRGLNTTERNDFLKDIAKEINSFDPSNFDCPMSYRRSVHNNIRIVYNRNWAKRVTIKIIELSAGTILGLFF